MLVWVLVFLFVMGRVLMFVGAVFPGVIVIMHMNICAMLMRVRMLMKVLVRVGVIMLVGVDLTAMQMLMGVLMSVSVGMQVPVFVFAFHGPSLLFFRSFKNFL